jgi:hypothetical protein
MFPLNLAFGESRVDGGDKALTGFETLLFRLFVLRSIQNM